MYSSLGGRDMIEKNKFNELIETFMGCAALFEKSLAFADILDSPELYGVDERQVNDMKDIVSFHKERYDKAADELEKSLADILTKGKDAQKEYLGYEAEYYNQCEEFGDAKLTIAFLDISFKEIFAFSVPAYECKPKDRITVFLKVLKNELKS